MKVKELRELLENVDGELEVRIPVAFEKSTLGPQPSVHINERIYEGFDWDSGNLFITPKVQAGYQLLLVSREFIKSLRKKENDEIFKRINEKGKL